MSYCCTWMTAGEYMGCFQPCTYRYLLPRLKGTYGYMHRMFSTVHIGISFRNKRALMDTCIYDWRGIYGMCFECIPASAPRNGTSLLWVQGHLQSANSEVYFSISVNLRSVYSKHIYIYVKYWNLVVYIIQTWRYSFNCPIWGGRLFTRYLQGISLLVHKLHRCPIWVFRAHASAQCLSITSLIYVPLKISACDLQNNVTCSTWEKWKNLRFTLSVSLTHDKSIPWMSPRDRFCSRTCT